MHHISLYLCGSDENHIEQNAHGLGKVSCGKGCIRFKKLEKLNLEVALELVKRAAG